MTHLFRCLTLAAMIVGGTSCSEAGEETVALQAQAPPADQESLDNCAVWSCSWQDCSMDPGVYGPCCVAITPPGVQGVGRGSCGGSQYPQSQGCGPSTYASGEIPGPGCYCSVEHACCYWQTPSVNPDPCNGGPS